MILGALLPFRLELKGVAVESTFNWYWLVDGLQDAGFNPCLVNTTATQQYKGLKHTDDAYDAFWLAHLMRLGILPTGYIYPQAERPLRDLLRKRLQLVRHRVTLLLSAQSQIWRCTGVKVNCALIKQINTQLVSYLDHANQRLVLQCSLNLLKVLNEQISAIERSVEAQVAPRSDFQSLQTVDGIGPILGSTIALETGDIKRFPTVGQFASYCRCVDAHRFSNGKKKEPK
ncbi:transposase [Motiliproteus sp. MSK22-1]|uniref:transposase n=1 Tax=Motiliproteus sp. MSK22-1 TaxID=1897630 RepID=UPI001E31A085|nr:transposase [Motiliproteus sp. MSK22-1]